MIEQAVLGVAILASSTDQILAACQECIVMCVTSTCAHSTTKQRWHRRALSCCPAAAATALEAKTAEGWQAEACAALLGFLQWQAATTAIN